MKPAPRTPSATTGHGSHRMRATGMAALACAVLTGGWIALRGPAAPSPSAARSEDGGHETTGKPAPRLRSGRSATDASAGTATAATVDPRFTITPDPDFLAALAAADRVQVADERDAARLNALLAWAEKDPRSAFLHAASRPRTPVTSYQRDLLFQCWAAADFTNAEDFTASQPPGKPRESLLGMLAMEAVRHDPTRATAIVMETMVAGPAQQEATISVLHQWALKDRAAATAWAATFPHGVLREKAERELSSLAAAQLR